MSSTRGAPHRQHDARLRLAARHVARIMEDPDGPLPQWRTRGFARCVDGVRAALSPIGSRRALAESYAREALRNEPVEMAYALRWLELKQGAALPAWTSLTSPH